MKTYPISVVSRSLDPSQKALTTVVGMFEHHLSDADINLIQDLQDYKRQRILDNETVSGAVSWSPFVLTPTVANTFQVPAFNVLFKGEIVTIAGNLSSDMTVNNVVLPPPVGQTAAADMAATVYIAFVEFRYTSLQNDLTAYYVDNTLSYPRNFFFPNGCRTANMASIIAAPDPTLANSLLMDVVDPFESDNTTTRAMIQWAIRIQPVTLAYNFTQSNGLTPTFLSGNSGPTDPANTVYASDTNGNPIVADPFSYTPMSTINGDSGLWRAGDGTTTNGIGALDGYSYAYPLAVIFQKNSSNFSIQSNPFGAGLLTSGVSGRLDGKFADGITSDEVVDTRLTVSLKDYEYDNVLRKGFVDLITGESRQAVGRGTSLIPPVNSLGSQVTYDISVAQTGIANTLRLGTFDGYMNGFCADNRLYYLTQQVSINSKNVAGIIGGPWVQGDAFSLTVAPSVGTIEFVQVMALVNDNINNIKNPVFLMQGQVSIAGLNLTNPQTVTITIVQNVAGTSFDPGANPLYVTLGISYAKGSGFDLGQIPTQVYGGTLLDTASGKSLPVFGVSEYENSSSADGNLTVINNEYSNKVFGVRATLNLIPGVVVASNSGPTTTVSIPNPVPTTWLASQITAWNAISGQLYHVVSVSTSGTLLTFVINNTVTVPTSTIFGVTLGGSYTTLAIPSSQANTNLKGLHIVSVNDAGSMIAPFSVALATTASAPVNMMAVTILGNMIDPLQITVLCANTAQLVYNAAVRGIVAIEETVLFGTYADTTGTYLMDTRVQVVSKKFYSGVNNIIVAAVTNCVLKGISGNDVLRYVWVDGGSGTLTAVPITSVQFTNNGLLTITIPATVNLEVQGFFMTGAILPAFRADAQLMLSTLIVPYQGEGVANRNYDVIYTQDCALVTTNGTGAAPLVGIKDVYPYNRELPIVTSLPTGSSWNDTDLINQPVSSYFDSNYESKLYNNVENVFEVPVYTNDFIQSLADDKRMTIQLSLPSTRGFTQILPHVGFAVHGPTVTSGSVYATTTSSPVNLYVNGVVGKDSNDGLSLTTPMMTIQAALATLPPILLHKVILNVAAPVTTTGAPIPYLLSSYSSLEIANLGGDSSIRANKYYALGIIGYSIQEEGSLTILGPGAVIDGTGVSYGDGEVSAFYVNDSRVVFSGFTFQGFINGAVQGVDSDIEFVDCNFVNNVTAGSFDQSSVEMHQGLINLSEGTQGIILSGSQMTSSAVDLACTGVAGPFYAMQYGSSLVLETHSPLRETGITSSILVATAGISSSIVCSPDFSSGGQASLNTMSVLQYPTSGTDSFAGGIIITDSSSAAVPSLG
jgi:hypothetical protein